MTVFLNKRVSKVIIGFMIAVAVYFIGKAVLGYGQLIKYRQQVAAISIDNVDLSKVPDGSYVGYHEVIWVAAKVEVTVKEHKIVDIKLLEHKNDRGKPAEVIPDKVVKAQTLDVDVVSGATSSSKVILKAIENALNSAK